MKRIKRTNTIPEHSKVSKGFDDYHFCDSFSVSLQTHDTIDNFTTNTFQTPRWADALMGVRNAFFSLFGLDKGGYKKNINQADYYPIGSRAVYFTVIARNENEIIAEEKDKHLDFRISVLKNQRGDSTKIHLTTLVKYHNFLGRFYFSLIRPFHRAIIISLLKKLS